jgi:hypothetical protein
MFFGKEISGESSLRIIGEIDLGGTKYGVFRYINGFLKPFIVCIGLKSSKMPRIVHANGPKRSQIHVVGTVMFPYQN